MIGRTISHYKIIEKIGEGGMGVVYRAEDTKLTREVALKFLPPEWARDAEAKARFMHEARAAAQLTHPAICTIYEIDEAEGRTFIAMALVEGGSLSDRIARGPMRITEAVDVAIRAAEGLSAAHAKGIVHRDVKPANVLLTLEGRPKVMDFGLAKSAAATQLTKPGTTTGTVAYMSPEQSRGEKVDRRTDVWSFGAMLYEMITGRRPFGGDHEQAVIFSILNDEPEPITGLRTGVPLELERIIRKAMTKRLDERYQHIDDAIADLRALRRTLESSKTDIPVTTGTPPPGATPRSGQDALAGIEEAVAKRVEAALEQTLGPSGTAIPVTTDTPLPGATARPTRRIWLTAAGIGAAAVVVALVGKALLEDTSPVLDSRTVAVAPFENRTGDESLDPVGQMAADWIAEGLDETGVVRVAEVTADVAASSARGRSGTGPVPANIAAIARETGGAIVVSGAYYLDADSLKIQARITDVGEGRLAHALPAIGGPKDAPAAALERLRSRVMGAVAAYVEPVLGTGASSRPPTYEAYRECVAGLPLFGTDYDAARVHFSRAARLDSTFVAPLIYEFYTYGNEGRHAEADSVLRILVGRRERLTPYERLHVDELSAAQRGDDVESLRLLRQMEVAEPNNGLVKYLIGITAVDLNRPQEAVDALAEIDDARPDASLYVRSWRYDTWANALHMLGDYEQELEILRAAREIYPDLIWLRARETRALVALGRLEEMEALVEESMAIPGRFGTAGGVMAQAAVALRVHGHREESVAMAGRAAEWRRRRLEGKTLTEDPSGFELLARELYAAERWEEAREIFVELAELDPDDIPIRGYLGTIAARLGDRDEAQRVLEEMRGLDRPYLYGRNLYWCGCIAALLGEHDLAVGFLREAFAGGGGIGLVLHADMDLEPLHGYPPFEELRKPKG